MTTTISPSILTNITVLSSTSSLPLFTATISLPFSSRYHPPYPPSFSSSPNLSSLLRTHAQTHAYAPISVPTLTLFTSCPLLTPSSSSSSPSPFCAHLSSVITNPPPLPSSSTSLSALSTPSIPPLYFSIPVSSSSLLLSVTLLTTIITILGASCIVIQSINRMLHGSNTSHAS